MTGIPEGGHNPAWNPFISVELGTVSRDAFGDAMERFDDRSKELREAGNLPPFPFIEDGWYDIAPQQSEAALFNSAGNRETSLLTVKNYAMDMVGLDWQPTGETIVASEGKLRNGHHRLMAGYLSGVTFRCFVVVSAPATINLFAYYDSGKKRNAADALHIAGLNGSGRAVASAVEQLAIRYDAGMLGVSRQKRFRTPNAREVLRYVQDHPDLTHAARLMIANFPVATEVIGSKPAAVFFSWLVLREGFDESVLHDFCTPLGTGALLAEDSPLLAVRAKLLQPEMPDHKMPARTRLAYLCKAFMMHVSEQRMPRVRGRIQPLMVEVDEEFPRIVGPEPVVEQDAAAAE